MNSSIKLGKIWGIPIGINYSWIFVFLLFIFIMSSNFGNIYPAWSGPHRWTVAVVTTVLFFGSVLAHELSHSLVAMRKGIPVHGITLFIFGGVSQLGHEAQRPWTEFLVAVVGPVTSVLLGAALGGIWYVTRDVNTSVAAISFSLFAINLMLGIFNMLPGFPLDGGRVLRSVVWAVTGSYWRATQVAARAGQLMGGLMIGGGVAWFILGHFQGLWLAIIGGFLLVAATATYRQERVRERLKEYRVADSMVTDWQSLPGDLPLSSPSVAQSLSNRTDFLGVLVDGRMSGILTRRGLARVPANLWPYTSLSQVMVPWTTMPRVEPDEEIFEVLERMDNDNLDRVAVVRNGLLLGFLSQSTAFRLTRNRHS